MVVDPAAIAAVVDHKVPLNVPEELSGNLLAAWTLHWLLWAAWLQSKWSRVTAFCFTAILFMELLKPHKSQETRASAALFGCPLPALYRRHSKQKCSPGWWWKGIWLLSSWGKMCESAILGAKKSRVDCMRKSGKRTWLCLNGTIEAM